MKRREKFNPVTCNEDWTMCEYFYVDHLDRYNRFAVPRCSRDSWLNKLFRTNVCFRGKEGMRSAEINSAVSRKLLLESKKLSGEESFGKDVSAELNDLKDLLENKLARLEKLVGVLSARCAKCKKKK